MLQTILQTWMNQIGHALLWVDQNRHLLPLGIVGLLSWSVWVLRVSMSKLYRPFPVGYKTTTSVVVPAYREDPDILLQCLRTWLAEEPTEVIIVPDLEDVEVIARLRALTLGRLLRERLRPVASGRELDLGRPRGAPDLRAYVRSLREEPRHDEAVLRARLE